MRLTVIGSANADQVVAVEQRPSGGETLIGSDLVLNPGGKGANQAVAAGRLGADVSFFGCVGSDPHGAMLRASLAGAGVDITAIEDVPEPTGVAQIMVTPDGENSIVVSPGANRRVTPDYLSRHQEWERGDIVILQHEVPLETVTYVGLRCRKLGKRLILNAAPAADILPEVMSTCDPLVVNETEAAAVLGLTGDDLDPPQLARCLLQRGARSVVITLGAQGAVAFDPKSGFVEQRAFPVTALDTTGAGDAFVGALAAALAAGRDLVDALEFGARVSALVVQRYGAQNSYPSRDEVELLGRVSHIAGEARGSVRS